MSSEPSPTSHNKDTNTSIQLSAVPSMSTSRTATAALVPPSPAARARHHHEHDDDDNDEPLHRQFTSIESMVMSVAETMSDADSPTLGERFNDALFSQTPGLTLVALFGGLFFLPVIVFVSAEVVPFFRDWDAFSDVVGAHWFLVAAAACTCMSATLMYDARMITLQGYDEPQQFNSHEWVAACNVQGVEGRLSHRSSLLLLLVRLVAHAGATYLQFIKENEGDVTVGVVGDTLSGLYMLAESAVAGVVAAESPLLHWLTHPRYAVTPKMYAMVLPCGSHPLHSTCRWLMSQFLLAPLSIPLTLLVALPLQLVLSVPELVRFLFVDLPFRLLCDCARRHCGLCTYLLLAPFIVLGVVLALARVFIGLASAVFVIPLGLLLAGGSLVRSDSFSRSIPSAVMTVSIAATIYYDGGVAALVVGLNSTPNEQLVVLFAVLAGFCISPLLEPQSRTFSLRPISVLTRFTHPAMFMSSLGYVVWANELFTQLIGLPISLAAWFHMFPPGGVSLRIFAFIFGAPPQNVKPEPVSEFRKKRLMLALVHAQSNSEPEATEWLLEQYADILDTSVVEWTAQQCFEYELEHSPVGGKTFLDLSSSDDDAVRQTKRLVGLLKNNTFVETLFVHDVADEELAAVLAETIRVNRTINLLGLFLKQDELAPALLEAVQDNTGVQSLLLFPPGNDDHWVAQLLQLLRRNKHVKKLSVSGISDAQQQVVRDAWAETGRDPERLELK